MPLMKFISIRAMPAVGDVAEFAGGVPEPR
jgi:hypothetical protein